MACLSWEEMVDFFTFDNLTALFALAGLEVVLGIDNIVFLAILVERLDVGDRARARTIGLLLAMVFRILLLLCISWIMLLTEPLFSAFGRGFSGRDIILFSGGLFLIWKATHEIDKSIVKVEEQHSRPKTHSNFGAVLVQLVLVDIIFSLDSVITAVGIADDIWVMIAAIIVAICFMLFCSKYITDFIAQYPTIKILALAFLLLVGVLLVADASGVHINRGYIYFAMGFSLFVEILNIRMRKDPSSSS